MKIQQKRRERLFAKGRPKIRDYEPEDIKWLWAVARWSGGDVDPSVFSEAVEQTLNGADRHYILEDNNSEFESGHGPVGLVLATFDTWSLAPHVEWFPWASTRNKLRCTVGFFQKERYSRGTGCIKVYTIGDVQKEWFKGLRRYVPIYYVGKIPNGRSNGDEHTFYLRGREYGTSSGSSSRIGRGNTGRRRWSGNPVISGVEISTSGNTQATSSTTTTNDGARLSG